MDQTLPEDQTILEEIRHAVWIHRSPDDVFSVFTSHEGWNAWFTEDISLDPQPGGRIIFQWKDWGADHISTSDHGRVIEALPAELFSFTWHPDRPDYATIVEFTLEGEDDGTLMRVCERGFASTPEGLHAMVQSAAGWGEALTLLKMYLEHDIRHEKSGH